MLNSQDQLVIPTMRKSNSLLTYIWYAICLIPLLLLASYVYDFGTNAGAVSSAEGVSGSIFKGIKAREFRRSLLFQSGTMKGKNVSRKQKSGCKHWSVVTTIFKPSEAVQKQAQLSEEWCIVVVLDKKSPPDYTIESLTEEQKSRLKILDVKGQEDFGRSMGTKMVQMLPWNHFGRKNVGYLYAIAQGAEMVWDFDDDNKLIDASIAIPGVKGDDITLIEPAGHNCSTFNPYPFMGAPSFPCWPRGLPLTHIKEPRSYDVTKKAAQEVTIPWSSVGVVQSLANYDPDVDAIYRLTQPIPFDFTLPKSKLQKSVVVPKNSFTPLNAQAALFTNSSLWMLYLPVTIHGRVSDIWRSYAGQRLAQDIGQRIVFSPPLVTQYRNPHNYLADFQSEEHLYLRADAMVEILTEMKFKSQTLPGRIEEMWVELYNRLFIEEQDVLLIQEWIKTLMALGYQFPPVINN